MEGVVQVRIFGTLRGYVDAKRLDMPIRAGDSVRHVLARLSASYPQLVQRILDEDGKLKPGISIFVNGRKVQLKRGLDTAVEDGDRVAIFPAIGGG